MNKPLNHREIIEAEAIHRDGPLLRISQLAKLYGMTLADLAAALPNLFDAGPVGIDRPKTKFFDPFFDLN